MSKSLQDYIAELPARDKPAVYIDPATGATVYRFHEDMRGLRIRKAIKALKKARHQQQRDRKRQQRRQESMHPTLKPIPRQAKLSQRTDVVVVLPPR